MEREVVLGSIAGGSLGRLRSAVLGSENHSSSSSVFGFSTEISPIQEKRQDISSRETLNNQSQRVLQSVTSFPSLQIDSL